MLGHGLYSTFCDKENNQFLIRVYMTLIPQHFDLN